MGIWVEFTIACEVCNVSIHFAKETSFYSDEFVSTPHGWEYCEVISHINPKHTIETLLCPKCKKELSAAKRILGK